jgi:peptide/nickel transport system substrate-binding protein
MKRRSLFAVTGGGLLAPAVLRAQGSRVLRFVPQTDVGVLDPTFTTAYVTRNHAYMVFDTLFGVDDQFTPSPQMVEGATTEDDGLTWRLTLRDNLRFHDGTPVLARDVVAPRRFRPRAAGRDKRTLRRVR